MNLRIVYRNLDRKRPHVLHLGRRRAQQAIALCALCLLIPVAIGADLSGTVQRAGRPAAGVSVTLNPARPPATGPTRTATTDQSGRFKFTGLIPGDYVLTCGGNPPLNAPVRDRAENRVDCSL